MSDQQKLKREVPRSVVYAIVGIIVALLILLFIGASMVPPSQTLYPAEIRNYQGADLSSIGAIRENNIRGLQDVNESSYLLSLFGLLDKNLSLTYADVLSGFQSYRKVLTIHCVEGWSATILWDGVLVKDLLQSAGVKEGAQVAIFRASDGYSTALPLEYLNSHNIILAYKMNNITIPPERGFPFELVAESQYGYKWIKWVTSIEVSNNTEYRGYWESRGYPNNATVP